MSSFLIDLATPKTYLFFRGIYDELQNRGHKVYLVGRRYGENEALAERLGLPVAFIGLHGETVVEKAYRGIDRMLGLFRWMSETPVSALISLANPESTYVAYRLGIPAYTFIDIPEASHVARLTLPFSKLVFVPFVVPIEEVTKHAVEPRQIYSYSCLDPIAWMPDELAPMSELGVTLDWDRKIVVCREAEVRASYYDRRSDLTRTLVNKLQQKYPDVQFYKIPRYKPHDPIDVQSLLGYADVLISGGGTMPIEAAYWGTQVISCRPTPTYYDRYMMRWGLMTHARTLDDGVNAFAWMINAGYNHRAKALRDMKFPLDEIITVIEEGKIKRS